MKVEGMKMAKTDSVKVITGSLLIDGLGGAPVERGAVVVEGSRISWAGPEKDMPRREGQEAQTHNFPEGCVMPGLVDVHTHTNLPGDGTAVEEASDEPDEMLTLRSAWNARKHLETGVTTARDNGGKNLTTMYLKEGIERGFVPGPRMVISGRPITITGGHCWPMGGEADGVDGVRQAARRLIKEGVDFIKIMTTGGGTRSSFPMLPSFNLDELQAITYEAHLFGKLVGAHCSSTQGIINSLDAGADMLIHCTFFEPDGSYKYDPKVGERIAETGVWVNPTLHVGTATLLVLKARQRERELSHEEKELLETTKRRLEQRLDSCRRLVEAGAKMVSGSDSGWSNYPMGRFQREVEEMMDIGLSGMNAILSGTREAAKSIGMEDLVGSLEPGKEADVLVVKGNPAQDIGALSRVEAVFKAGDRVV